MSNHTFAAAAALVLLAGPALAATPVADQPQTVLLTPGRVDFADAGQVQTLYTRINAAARNACSLRSADALQAIPDRGCIDRAVAEAVRRLDRPVLTAAYERSPVAGRAASALAINDQ
jgi:UrcA family protein